MAKRISKALMPPPLIFVAIAATVARAAVIRDGVGPFASITVAALIAVLLLCAFRLSRRAIRPA